MKISLVKSENNLKKGTVPVRLIAGNRTRLVEKSSWRQELNIGIGKKEKMARRKIFIIARRVVTTAKEYGLKHIAVFIADFKFESVEIADSALSAIMAESFEMANYEFNKFKLPPKDGFRQVSEIFVVGEENNALKKSLKRGQTIAREVNKCRDLANTPGGDMTPKLLARKAREAAEGLPINIRVLDRDAMKEIGMGAVLGVARGSGEEPQFIIMEYFGAEESEEGTGPIVLVGKGVTFDTGGLNLKSESGINDMHMDMSGGAAVIHAVALAAKFKLKKNIVALVPSVENMPSGSSYRPGDILKTLSGKTIEVVNTDAEGRIIMADALTYAERYKPRLVVDVATLTGASIIALGQYASAIMTKDDELAARLMQWGEESGDYVWPFPMWEEYDYIVKGNFGDVPNLPAEGNSRYAGVIGGGVFLYQFAKKHPAWAHIDMAPRLTSAKGDNLAKGAAGAPVRLLLKLLEEF